ncbi:MAG TPA: ThuA domain-containing protein [Sedimentisphaerales bacterium]|nr:ThuA domain-containing protein [Sedimentisphaerales bacterium]
MIRKVKDTKILLPAILCSLLLVSTLQAQSPAKLREVTAEEMQKIEKAMPQSATVRVTSPRKLLVFWRCEGFFHTSIPVVNKALEIMGQKTGAFDVVTTDDYSVFTPENLKQFDAVCLNNTTGLKFNPTETPERCKALMDFVKNGKGIVGVHAGTDNFNEWPEAQEMMGGKFTGHPWTSGGTWAIKIDEPDHPLMKAFKGKGFKIKDEIYRTDAPLYSRDKQLVLMSLDMSDPTTRNVKGFKPTDDDTGTGWVKTCGEGRVFYCSLGHNDEIFWNPAILRHYLDGIQFAFGDYKVDTKPKPIVSSGKGIEMATLQELLENVKTYDWGQSRLALTEVSDTIKKAHSSPAELKKIEKSLLDVLISDSTRAGKQFVCRELSIIGTEQSVPVLAKMLTDEETSDMARYALERIPGTAVNDALRRALRAAKGKPQVGIINSLGQRRDRRAARALGRLIDDSDPTVAAAAAAALGQIADSRATEALAAAKDKTSGKLQMLVLDSYLKCADQLVAEGDKAKALAIYKELQKEGNPAPIRTAALKGMISSTKK